jgi:hypothetical protein
MESSKKVFDHRLYRSRLQRRSNQVKVACNVNEWLRAHHHRFGYVFYGVVYTPFTFCPIVVVYQQDDWLLRSRKYGVTQVWGQVLYCNFTHVAQIQNGLPTAYYRKQ